MATKTVLLTLAADMAGNGADLTIAYPAGTNQSFFTGDNASGNGFIIVNDNDVYSEAADDVDITYGASDIELENNTGQTWAAGDTLRVGLAYATADVTTVIAQPAIADLAGTLTGTVDGTMADIAATAAATAGGSAPTAAQVDTGIATAVASIVTGTNLQLKELQTTVNEMLTALRAAGVLETS